MSKHMAKFSEGSKRTVGSRTDFQWWKTARSEGAYRCSEMVAREPVAEIFVGRQELARSYVSVHRRAALKPSDLWISVPHHPNPNEKAARHSMGTCHPVNGHRPKELVPVAIVSMGNKNKDERRVLPQLPSYRHLPTVCRWHSTAQLIEESAVQPRALMWQYGETPGHPCR